MSLRPQSLLSTALILLLATPVAGGAAQEKSGEQTEEQEVPQGGTPAGEAEKPKEPSDAAVVLSDRLTVRGGPSLMLMKANLRGDGDYRDPQFGEHLTTVNEVDFDSASGGGLIADAWYEIRKNWYIIGTVAFASFGQEDYTDSRKFSNRGGPGDTEFVSFSSQHEAELLDWAIGGARRVFPTKRYKDSRMYVDAIVLVGGTDASYTFESGELLSDPFAAPAFNPALGFDPRGEDSASYDLEYQTFKAGVRFGGRLGERFSLEGHFLPVWGGHFDATADLGAHGTTFTHPPGTSHDAIGDPTGTGADEVIQNDLFAPSVAVEQNSSRVRGMNVGINSVLVLNEWLSIDFGYSRSMTRSVGGKESRIYSDEDVAGCPSPGPVDPTDPNLGFLPPKCADDHGDLLKGSLVADSIYVMGRFRLY